MEIRALTEADVEETLRLEKEIFGDPWSEQTVRSSIEKQKDETPSLAYGAFGAFLDGRLVGYLFSMTVAGEGELHRIAADPSYRKRGVGSALMETFFWWLKEKHAESATLEVRSGNLAAISLYQKYGFLEEGVRKAYYKNPTEDARIFLCHKFPLES